MSGGVAHDLELLIGEGTDTARRAAQPQIPALQAFALGYQRARTEHHRRFKHCAIKNRRPHADKTTIGDLTAVQHDPMAYGDIVTNEHRTPARQVVAVVRDMQHRTVLDVCALTDSYAVHIAADHAHWPNGTLGCDTDVADHHRCLINPGLGVDLWLNGFEGTYIGHGN